jgi:hypothetical protein
LDQKLYFGANHAWLLTVEICWGVMEPAVGCVAEDMPDAGARGRQLIALSKQQISVSD